MKKIKLILSVLSFIPLSIVAQPTLPKGFTAYLPFPGYTAPTQSGNPTASLLGVDVNNQHGQVCRPGYFKIYLASVTTYDTNTGYPMTWNFDPSQSTTKVGYCTPGLSSFTYNGVNNPSGNVVAVQYSYGDGRGKYATWTATLSDQTPSYASCTLSPNAARFFTCITQ